MTQFSLKWLSPEIICTKVSFIYFKSVTYADIKQGNAVKECWRNKDVIHLMGSLFLLDGMKRLLLYVLSPLIKSLQAYNPLLNGNKCIYSRLIANLPPLIRASYNTIRCKYSRQMRLFIRCFQI